MNNYYEIFRNNFPYISREENTLKDVISNKDNIIIEEKNNNELLGFAIINKNTILLLFVFDKYRKQGIGTKLLNKCERIIKDNGYDKLVIGVGFNYLAPGVPTSKKYVDSVHEKLDPRVNDIASNFFEKRGYIHSWKDCNCFDMKMPLEDFNRNKYSIGDTINNILYRWATIDDLDDIVKCADDACQYQDEKFSKYYKNKELYSDKSNKKVIVAIKNNKIVGSLIVSIETEDKDLGCVGCTCVSFNETHQKIGTYMVMLGTKYLKDIGLKNASLSYTYTGLDKLYGYSGYKISCYYMMATKDLNSKKIYLKVPSIDELYYRQEWMRDSNTMSYNAGYDMNLKGYDKETGTITKTDEEMITWYNNWVNKEPDKYFAYIYDSKIAEPVGEVYYYLDNGIHSMGIVIQDKYRGKGYSYPALLELEKIAFEKNDINELSDYIPEDRKGAIKTFIKAGFIYTNNNYIDKIFDKEVVVKQLTITKDMYNKAMHK